MVQLIGRYKIEKLIGEGAMANVYRAHDPSIDRVLAIKVLKNEFRQNPEIVTRFLREAKAAGALSHPNIVTIYDVGEADDYPYIAMELLNGEPLDEHIAKHGRLTLKRSIRIAGQIARALHYAHGLGIVHRDIKPSNIVLCEDGASAKILDFGIARIGEADRVRAELNALRTQVGQVLGTPRYMSPEQALGLEIDHRSDLFSLGAVLHEMITGQPAFGGSSLATIALQITQQNPDPIAASIPDCPRGLQFVVDKLLAKQPEKRFASGADVANTLRREYEALFAERRQHRRGLSLEWRLTLVMGVATAVALLVSITAVLDRQYKMMERMALTSGTSIASFVATNVALRAVENAGLPAAQQDWLPVQAFVAAASKDPNVQRIVMADAHRRIRGSSDPARLGTLLKPVEGETVLASSSDQIVTSTPKKGFRFRRAVRYAGQPFGTIELVVGGGELKAAAASARSLLLGLGAALLLIVLALSYTIASQLARPIRQLKSALADAANGRLDYRISHGRRDEFGDLFDGFNALASTLEERAAGNPESVSADPSLNATRVDLPAAAAPQAGRFGRRVA
ncbi:protein kinase domain-containing protein [Sphingosinicella rhizophila]|uniref:Protein kinase n=1 Tax=Sphingosinicella rhizophila TaxID=3050082 RepID=A0ABU3Q636_9SPHN|nr:protein kinase [Sphingosinicella sp. GR2756]MDT9598860.1 protein kinase [Sphingosinicella sp. GR2756]